MAVIKMNSVGLHRQQMLLHLSNCLHCGVFISWPQPVVPFTVRHHMHCSRVAQFNHFPLICIEVKCWKICFYFSLEQRQQS